MQLVFLRGLTFALSGAPPRTLARRALLIGASVLERIVRRHLRSEARASSTPAGMPESDDNNLSSAHVVVDVIPDPG